MAAATFSRLQDLDTTEEIRGAGGWDFLEEIVDRHGLNVNTNKGGHDSRTLVDFKNDIIAALEGRLTIAELTAQFEQQQVQTDSDESETESQVEEREREREQERIEQEEINQGPDYYDSCDGRYHGGHVSDNEEDLPEGYW